MTSEKYSIDDFSMPYGAALYPKPPFQFLGARQAFATYEADHASVSRLLPPGVVPDSDPVICQLWVCVYPTTAFGPYLEAYIMVRARAEGERYWYQPVIFTDKEPALAAGREIWGFAKKLARMEWIEDGEQILFTVERPVDRLAQPDEIENLPILSFRYLPPSQEGRSPAAAELVRLDLEGKLHETANHQPNMWSGRASVKMSAESAVDPWHLL